MEAEIRESREPRRATDDKLQRRPSSSYYERPFATRRNERPRSSLRSRSPRREWREVPTARAATQGIRAPSPTTPVLPTQPEIGNETRLPLERNLEITDFPPNPNIPSTEEVMDELRELTYQYTNVSDPTEAEARRQRVLHSEQEGLMEETAARLVANAALSLSSCSLENGEGSNVSPAQQIRDCPPLHPVPLTPTSARKARHRTSTTRRSQASPRIFAGTNLRKHKIAQASNHSGFPFASPIQPPRRVSRSTSRSQAAPNRVGNTSSDFHTHPHPFP